MSGPRSPAAWDAARFATAFVGETPATILAIVQRATEGGLSERRATKLIERAEAKGLVHHWKFGATAHPKRPRRHSYVF